MNFKNFKLSSFIPNMIISLLYPLVKLIKGDNGLLMFSNSCLIIGLILIILAVVTSLYMHGDFDISRYVLSTKSYRKKVSFDKFIADETEKEKDSFNYPLLCSIVMIALSVITSTLV